MGDTEQRKTIAEQHRGRCVHFTGIQHDVCEKGHRYDAFTPFFRVAPCFAANVDPTPCPDQGFPSVEESDAYEREVHAALNARLEQLGRRECPTCKATYRGKQVGRCVYCEHCGTRLYHGTVPRG